MESDHAGSDRGPVKNDVADAPVKHIVMWNISGADDAEKARNISIVKEQFETLVGVIPGMTRLELGVDVSSVDYACDVVLYSEFETAQHLEDYARHPAHLAVRDAIEGLRIARHQVDYLPA